MLDATMLPGSRATALQGAGLGILCAAAVAFAEPRAAGFLVVPIICAGAIAAIDQRLATIRTRDALQLAVITLTALTIGFAAGRGAATSMLLGAAIWTTPLFAAAIIGTAGGGDFKYAMSLGLMTGWVSIATALTGLLLAVLIASVIGIATVITTRTRESQVRLGLPLFLGAVLSILATIR